MRILVDFGHPGHVHFYKHAIHHWRSKGYEVRLTARDKDVTLALLDHYQLPYQVLTTVGKGQFGLMIEFAQRELSLWRIMREFKPHIVTAIGGAFIGPVCRVAGVPSVVFTDSEHVALDRYLTYPLASVICTPHCFKKDVGPRQKRYRGFQELAYLDSRYFTPNPAVLAELGLTPQDPFALLRFIAWGAAHDVGHSGFTDEQKMRLVNELSKRGRVLVSVEGKVPAEIEPVTISVGPEKVHDLLYYASLYVGEGATMATEAGLLGTPAVYVSSLVGTMGNFDELARYGLVEAYQESARGVQRAIELMDDPNAKSVRQQSRQQLLSEMSDVTGFLCQIVEEYGRSTQ